MDVVADIPQVARLKPTHRSRVSNGSKLLPLADGRSVTARRFKDLIEFISVDLGGADRLSEGQRQLVRRAAALSAECERLEAAWARGEASFDIGSYSALTNSVRRVLQTLGLERVARDVTPSLNSYMAAKAATGAGRPSAASAAPPPPRRGGKPPTAF